MADPFGTKSAKKAAAAQEEANVLSTKRDALQAAQRRRETVREARAAAADSFQASASQGVVTSSAAQGAEGNIKSQFTSNLSFLDNQNLLVDQESAAIGRQRKYQAKAQRSSAIFKAVLNGGVAAAGFI